MARKPRNGEKVVAMKLHNHFIVIEPAGYEGDIVHVYRTDASLTRVKRYCRVMGYSLVAYGTMQVFEDAEYLSGIDMHRRVRQEVESRREWRKRLESHSPDELPSMEDLITAEMSALLDTLRRKTMQSAL